ncbi:C2 family cysteine protease [Brachybacterium sacelli]
MAGAPPEGPGPHGDSAGPTAASSSAPPIRELVSPGPGATGWRLDTGPLTGPQLLRPRQGRLGDCWVIAPMLAIHETAPERLTNLLSAQDDGTVTVHLPAVSSPIRVDRHLPVAESGAFVGARRDGAGPGWVGVLEKAIAAHVAGGYGALQRGFARFGLELLLGLRVRTLLRLPSAARIAQWRREGRALTASTHPFSSLVATAHGPLPPSHVFAVVGADPAGGHVHLRNPTRPGRLLVVDARTFRRGFLSLDVTPPLR